MTINIILQPGQQEAALGTTDPIKTVLVDKKTHLYHLQHIDADWVQRLNHKIDGIPVHWYWRQGNIGVYPVCREPILLMVELA
jgi:hypothetical protein